MTPGSGYAPPSWRALAFVALACLLGASASHAADCALPGLPARTHGADAAWLRINDVFVLHLAPSAPRLVEGSMVVPGGPAAELLGFDYRFERGTRTATFRRDGRSLSLRAGSATGRVDGAPVALPVPARSVAGGDDVLVPLRPLIDAFGLASRWDPGTRVLTLLSETALQAPDVGRVFLREIPAAAAVADVTPREASLRPGARAPGGACPPLRLEVTVEPTGESGRATSAYLMLAYEGPVAIAGPNVHVSDDPANTSGDPCRRAGERLRCRAQGPWGAVRYALAVFVAR